MCIEGDSETGGNRRFLYTTNFRRGAFGDVTFDIETREVDGVSYVRDPMTRQWKTGEAEGISLEFTLDRETLERITPHSLESDTLDGEPTYRVTASGPEPETELVIMWLGIDDLLPRQTLVEGHAPASNLSEDLVSPDISEVFSSTIFHFSKFNEPIVVVVPSSENEALVAAITDVAMANGRSPLTGEPQDVTDAFDPGTPEIYVTFKASAPANTKFEARWFLIELGDINNLELQNIYFTLETNLGFPVWSYFSITPPEGGWSVGRYEVTLLIDDEAVVTLPFTVE